MIENDEILPLGNMATLLEALPTPALLVGPDRALLTTNRLARDMVATVSHGDDLSRSLRNPALLAAVDQVLANGTAVTQENRIGPPPALIYEVTISPVDIAENDGDRYTRHALMVFIDQTSARQADSIRSTFVANVSHELRSPLTTLMGAVEALAGPAADDPTGRARMLALMGEETRRMKNLIDDLLSLSRAESQEFIPPGREVDLLQLLESAKERLAERAAARDMTIVMNIVPNLPGIPGIDDELLQVFDNLISNAIKYGLPGKIVTVQVGLEEQGVRFSVHNEGTPIPAEHLPRLTERFYRVDKSRSREQGGTGLGLAIVKHIVNRHRGELSIESTEEAGTIFSVTLPLAV